MIGYDDFLDGYLETEVDENVQNSKNSSLKEKEKLDKLLTIVEDDEETEVAVEELIEELPTGSESEVQLEPEQYKWIDDLEEQKFIASQNSLVKLTEVMMSSSKMSDSEIDVIIPLESDGLEIELTGPEPKKQENTKKDTIFIELDVQKSGSSSSSDHFYDVFEEQFQVDEEFPCSIQLTEPNYSQFLKAESLGYQDICRICNCFYDSSDDCNWLMCFGCGEAFHRTCLKEKLRKVKCEMPLIYRPRLEGPEDGNRFTHAPWFCNNCVKCSHCDGCLKNEDSTSPKKALIRDLKESFASCRHCGKVTCLACYNSESSSSNNFVQLSRFSDLKNYSCPSCLQCINCGLNARLPTIENRRKSIVNSLASIKQNVILYDDLTLCRPCYLSNQICATCPRCNQIYHNLPDHYDFGEANFNSDFSLCPMVSCDDCGSWTHCQCEGIDEKEYERIGSDKSAKFTCINCIKIKGSKRSKQIPYCDTNIYRIGNFMLKNDFILFNFWCFDEPWRRKTYKLSYRKDFKNPLVLEIEEDEKIETDSIKKLISKFTEKFKNSRVNNLNCLKAINPNFLFDPLRLLKFLESTKKQKEQKEFCSLLRDEILTVEEFVCARTRPFKHVKNDFFKTTLREKRRLSLTNLPEIKMSSEPVPVVNTGKMTVKFLYSQYVHTLKSDLEKSFNTTDFYSCGLALRPSAIAGFGLFATRSFQRNSLIIEYCGEMLTGEPMVNKRDAYYNSLGKRYQQSCYLFRLDELKVLDATHKGNLSRFINHSCEPNCYSRVVQIDSCKKLLIFASKIIEAGEEIVYDYKFPDEDQKIPCLCGSEKCRKWMN